MNIQQARRIVDDYARKSGCGPDLGLVLMYGVGGDILALICAVLAWYEYPRFLGHVEDYVLIGIVYLGFSVAVALVLIGITGIVYIGRLRDAYETLGIGRRLND